MKFKKKTIHTILITLISAVFLSAGLLGDFQVTDAMSKKNPPLSLADILTGLRSKKTSLKNRNKLLTIAVKQRGVSFTLTPEIEKELKNTGADSGLIEAIREKSVKPPTPTPSPTATPKPTPVSTPTPVPVQTSNPRGVLDLFDVEYDVVVDGQKGMLIRPDFTTHDLKGIGTQFIVFFETRDGKRLKAVNKDYASTKGSLIVYQLLKPCCNVTYYTDVELFLPYNELNLGPGYHELRMNINLIYDNGTVITNFGYRNFWYQKG